MPAFSTEGLIEIKSYKSQFINVSNRMRRINELAGKEIFQWPNVDKYLEQYKKDILTDKPILLEEFNNLIKKFNIPGVNLPYDFSLFFEGNNLPTFEKWLNTHEEQAYEQIKNNVAELAEVIQRKPKEGESKVEEETRVAQKTAAEKKFSNWVPLLVDCLLYTDSNTREKRFAELRKLNLLPLLAKAILTPQIQSLESNSPVVKFRNFLMQKSFNPFNDEFLADISQSVLPALKNYLKLLTEELRRLHTLLDQNILDLPPEVAAIVKDYSSLDPATIKHNLDFLALMLEYSNGYHLFRLMEEDQSIPYAATNEIIQSYIIWRKFVNNMSLKTRESLFQEIPAHEKTFFDEGTIDELLNYGLAYEKEALASTIDKALKDISTFSNLVKNGRVSSFFRVRLPAILEIIENFPQESKQYFLPSLKKVFDVLTENISSEFSGQAEIPNYNKRTDLLALKNSLNKFSFEREEKNIFLEFNTRRELINSSAKHPLAKIKEELELIAEYHNKARGMDDSQNKLFKKESEFANFLHHLFILKLAEFELINNPEAKLENYGYEIVRLDEKLDEKSHTKEARELAGYGKNTKEARELAGYGKKGREEASVGIKIQYKDVLNVNDFWNVERFPLLRAYEMYEKLMPTEKAEKELKDPSSGAAYRGP